MKKTVSLSALVHEDAARDLLIELAKYLVASRADDLENPDDIPEIETA